MGKVKRVIKWVDVIILSKELKFGGFMGFVTIQEEDLPGSYKTCL